jgi:BASS family bile acid:Na+ symporter
MTHGLAWLAARGGPTFAIALALGLAVPSLAGLLRPALSTVVLLLTFLVLLRTDLAASVSELKQPWRVALLSLWVLLATPVLALLAARLAGLDDGLTAALVVTATAPPLTSAPAFARIMGLDAAFALTGSLVPMLFVPVSAPPLARHLAGLELSIGVGAMMARLAFFVGLPMLAAVLVRRLVPAPAMAARARMLDGLVVLALGVFATAVMDGVSALALAQPGRAAAMVVASFAHNWSFFALTALIFAREGRVRALTAGLLGGSRQMALMLAVLPADAPRDVVLFLAVAQFPLYLNPFLLKPLLARLLREKT